MSLSSGGRWTASRALGVLAGFVLTAVVPAVLTPEPSGARANAPAGVTPLPSQVAPGQIITIAPEADTYVSGSLPGTNFGTADHFDTYGGKNSSCVPHSAPAYGLLRFDLSAIPAGSVISDARIVTTTRAGWAQDGDPNHHAIFMADDSWQETGVTWNTRPSDGTVAPGDPTLTTGGDVRSSPRALGSASVFRDTCLTDPAGNELEVFPSDNTGSPKPFAASKADLISRVGIERAGDGKLSIELYTPNCEICTVGQNMAYWARYSSREAADPAVRPFLEVTLAPSGLGLRLLPSSAAVTAAGSRVPLAGLSPTAVRPAAIAPNQLAPTVDAQELRALDLADSPLGSIPFGSIPLGSIPLGSIPLDVAGGWAALLQGTVLEDIPPQNVTFDELIRLNPPGLSTIPIQALDLSSTPLGSIPLGSIAYATLPLGSIPLGSIGLDW